MGRQTRAWRREAGNDVTEHAHCITLPTTDDEDGDKKWCGYQPQAVAVGVAMSDATSPFILGRLMTVGDGVFFS